MKKTISGIMCGIIAAGLLAGCAGVSESNPSEKKTSLTESKIYQEIILMRLSDAIKKNDLMTVKKHVQQDKDIIKLTDADGRNILHYAACFHSMEVFQWLLDQGMDIHATDKFGNTVLHLLFYGIWEEVSACGVPFICGDPLALRWMVRYNILTHNILTWYPLYPETILEMAKYLVERKVDINAENKRGETPVSLAAEFGYCEVVKCLVERGANVNLRDKDGSTSLDLAEMHKHQEIVKYLKAHGAVSGKSLNGNNKQ